MMSRGKIDLSRTMESKMAARCKCRIDKTLILMGSLVVNLPLVAGDAPSPADISLYASFDEMVQADVGGELRLRTRADHPEWKGEFVFRDGFPASAFQISKGTGVSDGALECRNVLDLSPGTSKPARGGHFKTDRGVND
jgi:hypothetical protein